MNPGYPGRPLTLTPRSAYSLSGHVSVELHLPYTLPFQTPRRPRFLLQSLELVFEGKAEIVSPYTGYSSFRICSISSELIQNAFELTSSEDSSDPGACFRHPCRPLNVLTCAFTARWNILFNLTIPGWLPASSLASCGNSYRIYATAKLVTLGGNDTWLDSLTSPFRSNEWTAEARRTIRLRRFIQAPSEPSPGPSTISYVIKSKSIKPQGGSTRIPDNVIQALNIVATVPSFIDVKSHQLETALRLRTEGLDSELCQRLRLNGFSVDVIQGDKCRYVFPS